MTATGNPGESLRGCLKSLCLSHAGVPVPLHRTLYMAVDDPNSLPVKQLQNIPSVQLAFDPDEQGEAAARVVKKLLPQSKRLKWKASDWNQQLRDYLHKHKQQRNLEQD
ncbi:MAG: hypothetical protein RM347_002015 [Nostoc sp. ChiQUE02]|uniref:hypothetical protein n=1 Tax=Nostoc sp. ChiQUE02 TaxID=3075377 RepID=UPI002AD55A67|nr:hypothetical protein [Nostoc sp. ChiQUE02]MDZ8235513.1 hypothetical protein [Nostoc sp. ChiQUE02]